MSRKAKREPPLWRIDMGWCEFNERAYTAGEARAVVKKKTGKRIPVGVHAVRVRESK